jgi:hypothetical protein
MKQSKILGAALLLCVAATMTPAFAADPANTPVDGFAGAAGNMALLGDTAQPAAESAEANAAINAPQGQADVQGNAAVQPGPQVQAGAGSTQPAAEAGNAPHAPKEAALGHFDALKSHLKSKPANPAKDTHVDAKDETQVKKN